MTALKMGGFLYTLHKFNVSLPPNFGMVSYLQILFGMLQWTQQGHPESEKRKEQTKTRPRRKCEKMENKRNTGYILYDFMMKEMGLDGVALKVYALIYSFTKAGSDCRGSVRYIGERTDSAKSSAVSPAASAVEMTQEAI